MEVSIFVQVKRSNMANEKGIKLTPPEGWEIDEEKSSLKDCNIVYKEKKKETFADVLGKVNGDAGIYFSDLPEGLADKIEALGKLAIAAEYVNNPELNKKWYICIFDGKIEVMRLVNKYQIGFTSVEAAKRAIDILGEDVIRAACK